MTWIDFVFNVDGGSLGGAQKAALQKYGSTTEWSDQQALALKAMGFGADGGAYSVMPWVSGIAAQIPAVWFAPMDMYPMRDVNIGGSSPYCAGAGIDRAKFFGMLDDDTYWNYSTFPSISLDDAFDPCFVVYTNNFFRDSAQTSGPTGTPYTVGVETGEGDFERGFGAGPSQQDGPTGGLNTSQGFATITLSNDNPNIAMSILLDSPWGTSHIAPSAYFPLPYSKNRTVYGKQELANWLQGNGQVNFNMETSASSSAGTVTMTFSSNLPLPYSAGDKINAEACSNSAFDGTAMTVVTASAHTITYVPGSAGTVSGVTNCVVSTVSTAITGATLVNGTETVTMGYNPYKSGDVATISGVTPTAFNTGARHKSESQATRRFSQ